MFLVDAVVFGRWWWLCVGGLLEGRLLWLKALSPGPSPEERGDPLIIFLIKAVVFGRWWWLCVGGLLEDRLLWLKALSRGEG
jgi:hypothetical protein